MIFTNVSEGYAASIFRLHLNLELADSMFFRNGIRVRSQAYVMHQAVRLQSKLTPPWKPQAYFNYRNYNHQIHVYTSIYIYTHTHIHIYVCVLILRSCIWR
jgi:hypothetical protein